MRIAFVLLIFLIICLNISLIFGLFVVLLLFGGYLLEGVADSFQEVGFFDGLVLICEEGLISDEFAFGIPAWLSGFISLFLLKLVWDIVGSSLHRCGKLNN